MNLSDLKGIFGVFTPWLLLLGALFVASVILVALFQGRPISLWRLIVGSPPEASPVQPGDVVLAGIRGSAEDTTEVVCREYAVDRARYFYQEIATYYDLRNSGNLVSTQLETIAQIQAIRARRSSLHVLDLGGGTGKLIAIHFFNDDAITWTYVDFCHAMAAEFERNLAGHPLGKNAKIVVDDLTLALPQLEPASYDVVVLSLVLSSMATMPDFVSIARLLASNGSLIVTDINPMYTHDNPLYKVPVAGGAVALRTTPVDPFEVIRHATRAGLRTTQQKQLGEGDAYYSFITIFTPMTVRPFDEERGDESLVRM